MRHPNQVPSRRHSGPVVVSPNPTSTPVSTCQRIWPGAAGVPPTGYPARRRGFGCQSPPAGTRGLSTPPDRNRRAPRRSRDRRRRAVSPDSHLLLPLRGWFEQFAELGRHRVAPSGDDDGGRRHGFRRQPQGTSVEKEDDEHAPWQERVDAPGVPVQTPVDRFGEADQTPVE